MTFTSYWDDPLDPKNDIEHFGVKGMKWGVRNENRMRANAHNKRIKTRYQNAKAGYKAGTVSKEQFKKARSARRQNLAGRVALAMTTNPLHTKVDQGRYYKLKSKGEGTVKALAKTYGMMTLRGAAIGASVAAGGVLVRSLIGRR